MGLRFSPSTGGFYDTGLHTTIPDDAVPITPARHAELIKAQANGAAIVPSPSTGRPTLQHARRDIATVRAGSTRAVRREAARRIAAISPDWRQLNDLRNPTPAGAVRFTRIDAVRAASDAIEAQLGSATVATLAAFPVRDNPLWPEFEDI